MNALHRHEEERVEEVLQNLRAKGIRITDTRRAVLSYLVASHEHPSAEKIYRDLLPQFPSMSLATVYNNIKVLIDEGVVSEIKVRNDTTTYFVSIERAVVRTGILLYDPRGQNDPRNRALDDQLDRLRVDESISGS